MTDFQNWARKPETKARLALAKENAWEQFTKQFPNADKNQFQVETRVQMGGIQSMSALPGDPTFNPLNNHYDVASYKRICAEFGIDPSSDFRFTRGKNYGAHKST